MLYHSVAQSRLCFCSLRVWLVCSRSLDAGLWNAAIGKHNSAIPPPGTPEWKAALPWQREQWAILMHGTMTDAAGALVRKEFSPHNLMLNVSDVHGQRIIL